MLEKNDKNLTGMAETYPAYEKLYAEKKDLQMKFNYIRVRIREKVEFTADLTFKIIIALPER